MSSSSTRIEGTYGEREKRDCHSMTRMSNENSISSPGINSSYLYRVSTRHPYVSKELIMYLTPMSCHTHINCHRSMCFHHTDVPVTVVPEPVAVFHIVYHYTKRAMLTRLLDNVGPAIYVVHLNKYFVILPVLIQ